jgi:coproporphyrinogen III oxidase-like Fe-S oxidoreductase
MNTGEFARSWIKWLMLGERKIALQSGAVDLKLHFSNIEMLGLYLHIPFCRQICPYCPYNKTLYDPILAEDYTQAVLLEIDRYSEMLGNQSVTSFYIGGGTPTTMLYSGLPQIIEHIYRRLNMQCSPHMESHPNDLSQGNLDFINALGVKYLSTGIEALQEHHLRALGRNYTPQDARGALRRAADRGFRCLNADLIFALPNQTHAELRQSARELVELGVDQVAAYPLFDFAYTRWPELKRKHGYRGYSLWSKRRMLEVLEEVFYTAGYRRTSVWAFTRNGAPKYCSVTVPLYLGIGASAGSYLRDIFYLNTFNVKEYIHSLEGGHLPTALSLPLTRRMQMAGWLYWRIYETRFTKSAFLRRFGERIEPVYGKYFRLLSALGLLQQSGDEVRMSDSGAYWLHALQDIFSIDYVARLWGTSQTDPWPNQVVL